MHSFVYKLFPVSWVCLNWSEKNIFTTKSFPRENTFVDLKNLTTGENRSASTLFILSTFATIPSRGAPSTTAPRPPSLARSSPLPLMCVCVCHAPPRSSALPIQRRLPIITPLPIPCSFLCRSFSSKDCVDLYHLRTVLTTRNEKLMPAARRNLTLF